MIIVAESGSTKTDWVILQKEKQHQTLTTSGFNPNYFPVSVLEKSLAAISEGLDPAHVNEVYFYGSGCSSSQAKNVVQRAVRATFGQAGIFVEHDLFGAARALFGKGSGIACILGTGSSSCRLENGAIAAAVPSLGYLLADEGSGMDIGKRLLNAFFKNQLPDELHDAFEKKFPYTLEHLLGDLYTNDKPNAKIASFVPFAVDHRQHPFVKNMVEDAFRNFFQSVIMIYPDAKKYPLGFAGSIAWLFAEQLHKVSSVYELQLQHIIKNPIDRLAEFHGKFQDEPEGRG